jgi:hypothetical protein
MGYRDLMSTSAPPADPRNELHRLAEEQAALRRVATLVASGAPSAEVFSAVAREVAQVLHLPAVGVFRYDSDGLMTVIATWSDRPYVFQPGSAGRSTARRPSHRYNGQGAQLEWRTTQTFPVR